MDLENLKNEIDAIFASKTTITVYDFMHLPKYKRDLIEEAVTTGAVLCSKNYSYTRRFYS